MEGELNEYVSLSLSLSVGLLLSEVWGIITHEWATVIDEVEIERRVTLLFQKALSIHENKPFYHFIYLPIFLFLFLKCLICIQSIILL